MTIQKFRKKPVEIQAIQYTGDNGAEIGLFVGAADRNAQNQFLIHTLEGTMAADPGDWIIRGVQGEFYPCKPDIFDATYESVERGVKRGAWVRRGEEPALGSKLVAGNTGKVVYEVVEHPGASGSRRNRVRLRDTRNGRSVGWQVANYYRYVTEEKNA